MEEALAIFDKQNLVPNRKLSLVLLQRSSEPGSSGVHGKVAGCARDIQSAEAG